jgi:hypothetical protein
VLSYTDGVPNDDRWGAERLPGGRAKFFAASLARERTVVMILSPTLDRVSGDRVSFAGSARSDPRTWNGRPDGSGEAAMPHRPDRGCHCGRGSTLTSWRSGRRSGERQRLPVTSRRVPKTERADRAHPLRSVSFERRSGGVRIDSARPTVSTASQQARGHHTQDWSFGARALRGPDSQESRRYGVTILRDHDPSGSLVESLILAQDQRWRRA